MFSTVHYELGRPRATHNLLVLMALALMSFGAHQAGAQEEVPGSAGQITLDATQDAATSPSAFPPDVQAAIEKFKTSDFQGAKAMLQSAYEKNNKLPPPGVLMGTLYFQAKQAARARASFEEAVRDNPQDPEAYVVFGDNALQQRRFTDAMLLYEKCTEVADAYTANPERQRNILIRANNGIAAVAEAREDYARSEAALTKVLDMDAANVPAMTRLGRVLFQQREGNKAKEQEAYDVFKKLYEIDPAKMTRFEINMARLYQQSGQGPRAQKLISLALDRDGDNLATQLAAAQWALETGNMEMAEAAAKKALELDKESMQVRLLQGLIARLKQDYPAAEAALIEAQRLTPSNAIVLNQLAISLGSQDSEEKQTKAFEFAQMATRLFGNSNSPIGRECAVTLAWVMSRLDRKEAAMKQLESALRAGPVGPDASYYAAEILHDSGRSDAAIKLLQNAIENGKGVFPSKTNAEQLLRQIRGA